MCVRKFCMRYFLNEQFRLNISRVISKSVTLELTSLHRSAFTSTMYCICSSFYNADYYLGKYGVRRRRGIIIYSLWHFGLLLLQVTMEIEWSCEIVLMTHKSKTQIKFIHNAKLYDRSLPKTFIMFIQWK